MAQARTPTNGDPYWFGKEVARLARLALIAEHVGCRELVAPVLDRIADGFRPWLDPTAPSAFRYDATHGGLLTLAGANGDLDANFGHARYNDHHFHHGYLVYAAAVLARHRPDWWTVHRSAVLSICMDYFYVPSDRARPRSPFPRLRHFDPYDGHSWASGTTVFADNRNQESTSEAVNAYYATALLAKVDQNAELEAAARVVLGMELRAARTYWQMTPPPAHSAIPDDGLRYAADIIVWSTKADHATWFGNLPEFIHGIQFLPFTPITHALLDSRWLQRISPMLHQAMQRQNPPIEVGWRGLLLMASAARGSAAAAYEAWRTLSSMSVGTAPGDGWDNGNSKSNALYWVAANAASMYINDNS
ncbi:endo-1,3(4)-beta-glucanase [Thamnocephalis sphaerospora]|uniref:glucan endo-1,3-beta-D-glucosidase n=1 Tax=Thamnocephalis sphaerospora TaxID=78915 RepID=A0A4V1IVY0_9FUNG|nr:endo-1,3(4)-beta-glucanase [Thamnocephalis sphaerospora]|eukprot:RKP05629.1 endo-1,3(4)-beta-glucanase [Thamnocephalis sphaerospora]